MNFIAVSILNCPSRSASASPGHGLVPSVVIALAIELLRSLRRDAEPTHQTRALFAIKRSLRRFDSPVFHPLLLLNRTLLQIGEIRIAQYRLARFRQRAPE